MVVEKNIKMKHLEFDYYREKPDNYIFTVLHNINNTYILTIVLVNEQTIMIVFCKII